MIGTLDKRIAFRSIYATGMAAVTLLLSSCTRIIANEVQDFACRDSPYTHTLNLQYDKEENKIKLISFKDNKGGSERVMGEIYDAFEKGGVVLWKIQRDDGYKADAFFNIKQEKLDLKDGGGGNAIEQTLKCKRIDE